ncbi:MAG: TIGR00296 family protein [Halodesulfurarchaeum sp.]
MEPDSDPELDTSQGVRAVRYARETVESAVESGSPPPLPESVDPVFEVERGAFVTLEKGDQLRGCIGRPLPEQTAIEAIRAAAVGAATDDPRFRPIESRELDSITVEMSVLTPPETLETVDPSRITVGRDGLIVSRGGQRGLLLPQVPVDRGWDAETFLAETCRKAGLPGDCWQSSDGRVERFEAQVFAEAEPRGPIEPVELDGAVIES